MFESTAMPIPQEIGLNFVRCIKWPWFLFEFHHGSMKYAYEIGSDLLMVLHAFLLEETKDARCRRQQYGRSTNTPTCTLYPPPGTGYKVQYLVHTVPFLRPSCVCIWVLLVVLSMSYKIYNLHISTMSCAGPGVQGWYSRWQAKRHDLSYMRATRQQCMKPPI